MDLKEKYLILQCFHCMLQPLWRLHLWYTAGTSKHSAVSFVFWRCLKRVLLHWLEKLTDLDVSPPLHSCSQAPCTTLFKKSGGREVQSSHSFRAINLHLNELKFCWAYDLAQNFKQASKTSTDLIWRDTTGNPRLINIFFRALVVWTSICSQGSPIAWWTTFVYHFHMIQSSDIRIVIQIKLQTVSVCNSMHY